MLQRKFWKRISPALCRILAILTGFGIPHAPLPVAHAQPVDGSQAKKLIEEGINAYKEGKYQEAVDKLTQAHPVAPAHGPTALYLGLTYLRQERLSEAIAAWQEYVVLEPYTDQERQGDLKTSVNRYLTLLVREENHRAAQEAATREQELGPSNPQTVAITYYRNLGSPDLSPLEKGLTALLISDVSQVEDLTVVERDRLQALLEELQLGTTGLVDTKTAPRVGRLLGAGKVATGSYLDTAQEEVRLDSVVAESATATVVGIQKASGRLQQFYALEKLLALAILKDLGYDEQRLQATGVLDRVLQPHTKSLAAFTAFSAGLDAKDRGDYPTARAQLEQSLRADPNFELARKELLALPLMALAFGSIATAVESSAPSASAATAGMAGSGVSGTTVAAIVGTALVVGGVLAGVLLSGGGGGGGSGKRRSPNAPQFSKPQVPQSPKPR